MPQNRNMATFILALAHLLWLFSTAGAAASGTLAEAPYEKIREFENGKLALVVAAHTQAKTSDAHLLMQFAPAYRVEENSFRKSELAQSELPRIKSTLAKLSSSQDFVLEIPTGNMPAVSEPYNMRARGFYLGAGYRCLDQKYIFQMDPKGRDQKGPGFLRFEFDKADKDLCLLKPENETLARELEQLRVEGRLFAVGRVHFKAQPTSKGVIGKVMGAEVDLYDGTPPVRILENTPEFRPKSFGHVGQRFVATVKLVDSGRREPVNPKAMFTISIDPGAIQPYQYFVGWLGIRSVRTPKGLARKEGLQEGLGLRVKTVELMSPAYQAGIKQGDVILSIDGMPLTDNKLAMDHVRKTLPGTASKLEVWRDGQVETRQVTIGNNQTDMATANAFQHIISTW